MQRPRENPAAFTLVELLVVISILALLIALLLPSLGNAKVEALRVKTGVNMRFMMQAFMTYAADNKSTLPGEPTATSGPGALATPSRRGQGVRDVAPWMPPSVWAKNSSDRTLYNALDAYQGLASTAHPSMGSPSWRESYFGNPTAYPAPSGAFYYTAGIAGSTGYLIWSWFSSPWALHFGYDGWKNALSGTNTTPFINGATPLRIDGGTAQSLMMADSIIIGNNNANGANDPGYYLYSHRKAGSSTGTIAYGSGNEADPNNTVEGTYASNRSSMQYQGKLSDCAGGFMGYYNGAVVWQAGPIPYRNGAAGTGGQANNLTLATLPNGWVWKSGWDNSGGPAFCAVGNF